MISGFPIGKVAIRGIKERKGPIARFCNLILLLILMAGVLLDVPQRIKMKFKH